MPSLDNLAAPVLVTAAADPDRPAVVAPDGSATYAQLVRCASALARRYAAGGVEAGGRVGVVLPAGRAALTAALAALLRGAAYVSIDPAQPDGLVDTMLRTCGVRVAAAENGRTVRVDQLVTGADIDALYADPRHGTAAGGAGPVPADVAYVIHTSGSTGRPKGIQVQHDSVLNLVADLDARAPVPAGHRGSWWTSPSFDVSIWEVWSPLCAGGTVVVVPPEDRLDADRLVAFLDRSDVASAYLPPGLLADVRDLLVADPGRCHGLARVLVGVEPIPLGLLQEIMAARPGLTIVNGYGPAETTICATLYTVPRTGGSPVSRTPIGIPVRGNRVHLLDPDGNPDAAARAGELLVAGRGVARGYVDGVAGGFTTEPGAPDRAAYRTGDLVQLLPDGNLVFAGRRDRQLKVNGYRVEPGEVETALRQVGRFRDVVVDQRDNGRRLAAYVVSEPGCPVDPAGIRADLGALLAPYAIPHEIVAMGRIPQTRNGKTDYAALAALDARPRRGASDPAAGLAGDDPVLRAVLAAYREVLDDPDPPADRAFVELGGASLGAASVAARLRTGLHRAVSPLDVLRAGSAADLARLVAAAPRHRADPPVTGRLHGPLSPAQAGLWLHQLSDPDAHRYVETVCFDIDGKLDVDRFVAAVRTASTLHPVCGARVAGETGLPEWVLRAREVPVEVLGPLDAVTRDRLVEAAARQPFCLDTGPLMRCRLLVTGDRAATAVFSWHHVAIDGWSARVFLTDLARCYADPGGPPDPPAHTVCDLALSRRPTAASRLAELVERLADGPVTVAWPPTPAAGAADGWLPVEIPPDVATAAAVTARRLGITTYVLLSTAFQVAVERTFGLTRFLLGAAHADRDRTGADRVVGYLINTVLQPAGGLTGLPPADMLARTAALAGQAARDAEIPFADVAGALLRGVTPRPVSFPQIYLSYDDAPELDLGDELRCTRRRTTGGAPKFELTLELDRDATGTAGRLGYRAAQLSPTAAASCVAAFLAAVAELSRCPGRSCATDMWQAMPTTSPPVSEL